MKNKDKELINAQLLVLQTLIDIACASYVAGESISSADSQVIKDARVAISNIKSIANGLK